VLAVEHVFSIPASPVTLTAITPDGPTTTRTFRKTAAGRAAAAKWIAGQQAAGRNVYYQDCSVRTVHKRPRKEDVSALHCAHVDIDARGEQEQIVQEKAAILARLKAYAFPPTDIIDTGNGFQAYWYLIEPLGAENLARIEAINKRLATDLGGDRCHDIAHLMRVPELVNFPNAKKIKAGRVVCESRIIETDHNGFANYRIDQLPEGLAETEADGLGAEAIDVPDSVDLSGLDPTFRDFIVNGPKPGDPRPGDGTDSDYTYLVACNLRRSGFSDGEILHVITNPDYAAAAHILRQKQRGPDPIPQARRILEWMNRDGVTGNKAENAFAADPVDPPTAEEAAEQERVREHNEKVRPEPELKGRPQVKVTQSQLPRAEAHAERILLAEAAERENPPDRIFQRDGQLVRLNRNLVEPGKTHDKGYRENNALLIVPVTPKWLAGRLDRSIQFIGASAGNPNREDGKPPKLVPKNAPVELVARMIENTTQWKHPHLFATIEAPTLRPDGSILDSPGYDKRTGLYFDPRETIFPKIKARPTKAEGAAALARINELLCDFPFVDPPGDEYKGVSRSVALAAVLTGCVRRSLDIAPAFAVTANEKESGKTELAKFMFGVVVGRNIPGQPFSDAEEERRKAIGAALREAWPVLFFDNVDNATVGGDFLEQVLTHPAVTDRVLQTTDMYTAPTNVLMLFNGNNITVAGAATTRVLLCRIVPDLPLAKRRFKYPNLFGHVVANRPSLVADALTALRAWIVADVPPDPKRDTLRFPQWDRLIAQALVWYGYADPARGGDELREADPVMEAKREVVRLWAYNHGDSTVTATDLLPSIKEAVASAKEMNVRDVNTKNIGRYVMTLVGARLEMDWKVVRLVTPKGEPSRWRLEWIGEPGMQPPNPGERAEPGDFDE
jgi:putative DNA primase/helicase